MIDRAELAPKRRHMRLHGTCRDEQPLADFNVSELFAHEVEHLRLAGRHHDATATRPTVHGPSIALHSELGIRGSPGCARPHKRLMLETTQRNHFRGEIMKPFETQGEQWGRHAEVWATELEVQMLPLFAGALEAVGPLVGKRLLDAGCGTGLAASLALAAGASVAGIDASTAFAKYAGERLPDAEFRVGDVEQLPYEDGAFSVVTAFNSIQYASDPAHAIEEFARVCEPGGSVAIGVWGDPSRCETDALFARLRSIAPPPPGAPAPLRISELGFVEALLEAAQLTISGGGEASCPFIFNDHDHAWEAHSSAGPLQKVIDAVGTEKVRDTLASVLEADRKPDGQLRQDNVFRYVIATKPVAAA